MSGRQALGKLLQELSNNRPELPQQSRQIVTQRVLTSLAVSWPTPPGQERSEQLDALCRKVHVAGAVKATYSPRWRKTRTSEPLAIDHWPLLVCVLLAYSIAEPDSNSEAKGRALKQLNAGFAAIDIATSLGVTKHIDALTEHARNLLIEIEQEPKA